MGNRRSICTLIAVVVLKIVFLAGCWDNLDLERRALVLGTFVDLVPAHQDKFELTMEVPILRRMAARPGAGGGGGSEGREETLPTWRLTVTGATFAEAMRKASTRSERQFFFGHQKVLLIGEELARRERIQEVLDFWTRNRESYLAITVLLAQGRAEEIFSARPKFARSVSMFLQEQSERQIRTSRFVKHTLAELLAALYGGRDILVSRVRTVPGQDSLELEVSGTGIIKEGKLVGWLSPEETKAALWVTGEARKQDMIPLPLPELKYVFTLELCKVKNKIRVQVQGDRPEFSVKLEVTADIAEKIGAPEPLNPPLLRYIEARAAEIMKERVEEVVAKLQKEYQADVLGFGKKIEEAQPRWWQQVKGNWRELYAHAPVHVEVKVKIRRTGMVS
ncbi:MAG: Ger(x)C family spore germination protein [Thermanaeromonas sp.]|uniref:Ger(x)C family spore germination protein n=1 Tax=Thermanaeromonas sp. TaxID=2003697 RepID=UPI0024401D30|nr:Ger(x)C family spore germination protein [Thermanaeromonas sp.]MCG0278770.1 Ger(x)C family spore germination protein [Thermanaeromonas sp.]